MILFYVPCPDQGTAEKIAKTLMTEKLVACANIIPGMQSLYWWQGNLESSTEFILILKTLNRPGAQETVTARVGELHPYEIPCIMTLPVLGINESYKKWLEESLR